MSANIFKVSTRMRTPYSDFCLHLFDCAEYISHSKHNGENKFRFQSMFKLDS